MPSVHDSSVGWSGSVWGGPSSTRGTHWGLELGPLDRNCIPDNKISLSPVCLLQGPSGPLFVLPADSGPSDNRRGRFGLVKKPASNRHHSAPGHRNTARGGKMRREAEPSGGKSPMFGPWECNDYCVFSSRSCRRDIARRGKHGVSHIHPGADHLAAAGGRVRLHHKVGTHWNSHTGHFSRACQPGISERLANSGQKPSEGPTPRRVSTRGCWGCPAPLIIQPLPRSICSQQ